MAELPIRIKIRKYRSRLEANQPRQSLADPGINHGFVP
jgi:hypothetical protein